MNAPAVSQRVDVVVTCLRRDLPKLMRAHENLLQFVPMKQMQVIAPQRDFVHFRNALGSDVVLLDENELIRGVTLQSLKVIPMARLSQGTGWYFQQLLKYQYAFLKIEDDHYLIWDADTVPLQPMQFFDAQGRMLLTKAREFTPAYFATYEKILGRPAKREFSFIAQHMLIRKSILREMLAEIEGHCPGEENWAWKIMRNLAGEGSNRFSEYETYGHYLKEKYPQAAVFRDLPWLRHGADVCGWRPSPEALAKLGETYVYASFEESDRPYRRTGRKIRGWLRQVAKKLASS
jgi:hypothetical protein